MMAETARFLLDHDTAERSMAPPDPGKHERLGRGEHNFDCAIWDRVREDAVLAGSFANSTQNPVIKQPILSTGTKTLAEVSPFDPVWGIGLREDDPEAKDPSRWRGKKIAQNSPPAVRDILRSSEAGLTHPASSHHFCTSTTTDRNHDISPAPPRPSTVTRACPGPPLGFFDICF